MNTPLEMFKAFLADDEAWDMFIDGVAGTGKTTALNALASYCEAEMQQYQVLAHTHKACGVLRTKLELGAPVKTLYSFIKKRPTINDGALKFAHVHSTAKFGTPEAPGILFIDEAYMIGEEDILDLRALQDPEYTGRPRIKIVWIGDPHQLSPIRDKQALKPEGQYHIRLKHIWRTDGPLLSTLAKLVSFIEGAPPEPLEKSYGFLKGRDLIKEYQKHKYPNQVVLAYTNETVQRYNFELAGKAEPEVGDTLFSPTLHEEFIFKGFHKGMVTEVSQPRNDNLGLGSKFKTLEFIIERDLCAFMWVEDMDGEEFLYPAIFGTYNYKETKNALAKQATRVNQEIEKLHNEPCKVWAKKNFGHPLARKRALAWRQYLALNESIVCFDFNYAMTIHKSQGSTYDVVFLDTNDLDMCRDKDFELYLKLYYVALSRASKYAVVT